MRARRWPRYRAQRLSAERIAEIRRAGGGDDDMTDAYGIWDSERGIWVDRYGVPDELYWAVNGAVAKMRARDLRERWEA